MTNASQNHQELIFCIYLKGKKNTRKGTRNEHNLDKLEKKKGEEEILQELNERKQKSANSKWGQMNQHSATHDECFIPE